MADNKKYYYLKLKENFYDSEQMIILQNMQDGYLYSDILMKLYLRSLKTDGKLMFNNIIPYTPNVLAQVVRHQVGTVEKALKVFKELGLVEILDNGAIYMLDIQNFIGKSSTEADRIRQYRQEISNEKMIKCTNVQEMYDKNTPEIEIEIEKEIDNNSSIYDFLQENGFVLAPIHYEIINEWEDNELTRYAIKKAVLNNKYNINYVNTIINSYQKENIKTIQQAKEQEEIFKNNKTNKKEKSIPKWFDKEIKEEGIDNETRRLIEEIEGTPTNNS